MKIKINYLSETPKDWSKDLDTCRDLIHLRNICLDYGDLTKDALEIADNMTEDNFTGFKEGLRKERRGKTAGNIWYNQYLNILLPSKMFKVSLIAEKFKTPFGTAYIRTKEENLFDKL